MIVKKINISGINFFKIYQIQIYDVKYLGKLSLVVFLRKLGFLINF